MQFWSLDREDPLEEGMATHSSILAWRTPWTEEPGGLQSIGLQKIRHDWSDLAHMHTLTNFITISYIALTIGTILNLLQTIICSFTHWFSLHKNLIITLQVRKQSERHSKGIWLAQGHALEIKPRQPNFRTMNLMTIIYIYNGTYTLYIYIYIYICIYTHTHMASQMHINTEFKGSLK